MTEAIVPLRHTSVNNQENRGLVNLLVLCNYHLEPQLATCHSDPRRETHRAMCAAQETIINFVISTERSKESLGLQFISQGDFFGQLWGRVLPKIIGGSRYNLNKTGS